MFTRDRRVHRMAPLGLTRMLEGGSKTTASSPLLQTWANMLAVAVDWGWWVTRSWKVVQVRLGQWAWALIF
jgi:hypothetical protein